MAASRSPIFRHAMALGGLGLSAACMGDPSECGHEQRRLEATGAGQIAMTIIQERPEQTLWVFWHLTSAELAGHVLELHIVDAANPDSVLLDLPVHPPESADSLLGFPLNPPSATGALYESVLGGESVAEMLTDLPQRGRVLAPLTAVSSTDWRDPVCD